MPGRKLIAVDTMDMPGKVILTYVEITNEIVPVDQFEGTTYKLLARDEPGVETLIGVLCGCH